MRTEEPRAIHLADYQAPEFRIHTVHLDFALEPEATRITARLAIEAGVAMPWHKWIGSQGDCVCLSGYGASAPANVLFEKFGFTVDNVLSKAKALLKARPAAARPKSNSKPKPKVKARKTAKPKAKKK